MIIEEYVGDLSRKKVRSRNGTNQSTVPVTVTITGTTIWFLDWFAVMLRKYQMRVIQTGYCSEKGLANLDA